MAKNHTDLSGGSVVVLGLWVMFTSSWSGAVVTNDSIGIEGSDFQWILDFLLVLVCNPSLSHSRVINNLDLQINHELAGCVSTGYGLDSGKQVLKVLTFKNGETDSSTLVKLWCMKALFISTWWDGYWKSHSMSIFDLNINSSKIKRKKYNSLVDDSQGRLFNLWQPGGKQTQLQVSYNEWMIMLVTLASYMNLISFLLACSIDSLTLHSDICI